MSTIIYLRGQLETAETIHVALTHRVAEARRVLAIAEADEQEARVIVNETKLALREAEDYERTLADARRWREHEAACRAAADRSVEVLRSGALVRAEDLAEVAEVSP